MLRRGCSLPPIASPRPLFVWATTSYSGWPMNNPRVTTPNRTWWPLVNDLGPKRRSQDASLAGLADPSVDSSFLEKMKTNCHGIFRFTPKTSWIQTETDATCRRFRVLDRRPSPRAGEKGAAARSAKHDVAIGCGFIPAAACRSEVASRQCRQHSPGGGNLAGGIESHRQLMHAQS